MIWILVKRWCSVVLKAICFLPFRTRVYENLRRRVLVKGFLVKKCLVKRCLLFAVRIFDILYGVDKP